MQFAMRIWLSKLEAYTAENVLSALFSSFIWDPVCGEGENRAK